MVGKRIPFLLSRSRQKDLMAKEKREKIVLDQVTIN